MVECRTVIEDWIPPGLEVQSVYGVNALVVKPVSGYKALLEVSSGSGSPTMPLDSFVSELVGRYEGYHVIVDMEDVPRQERSYAAIGFGISLKEKGVSHAYTGRVGWLESLGHSTHYMDRLFDSLDDVVQCLRSS